MKYKCDGCQHAGDIKDMPIKMGGLLCNNCHRIVFYPSIDSEYFKELKRRRGADDGKKRL